MNVTGDLALRPPKPSNVEPLHLLFRDPEVMHRIGDGRVWDLAYCEDFVYYQRELFHTRGYCFHTLRIKGRVAGFAGLHDQNVEWGPTGSVKFGYRLGKRYWDQDIAFDAARRVLSDVPHLPLIAMITAGSTRSECLALRLGSVAAESYQTPGDDKARCRCRGAGTGPRENSGPRSIRSRAMVDVGSEPTQATPTVLRIAPFGRSGNLPNIG